MHHILHEVKKLIDSSLKTYLPDVEVGGLEKDGAIFYMNGKDGTEFDWYVNDKIPPFMVFYNDEANMGAAKLLLYRGGETEVYLYGEQGKTLVREVHTSLDIRENDLLDLAVLLRNQADDQKVWGADIESINTDLAVSEEQVREFEEHRKDYDTLRNRKNLLNLYAYVSKQVTREGWRVGYMERNEPYCAQDSGWSFFAGTENDDYVSNAANIELVSVGAMWQQFDSDIFRYIDSPVGTRLIRVSPESFEIDKNDKEIYTMKR